MKRLLSAIIAISALSSLIIAQSANAIVVNCDAYGIEQMLEDNGYKAYHVDDCEILSNYAKGDNYYFLVKDLKSGSGLAIGFDFKPNSVKITFSDDTDFDFVQETVHKICPKAVIGEPDYSEDGEINLEIKGYTVSSSIEECFALNITEHQAKKICSDLNEKYCVKSFKYCSESFDAAEPYTTYLTAYMKSGFSLGNAKRTDEEYSDEELMKAVEEYIADNNLNCHVGSFREACAFPTLLLDSDKDPYDSYDSYMQMLEMEEEAYAFCVIPDDEMSPFEHFELANKLYCELGISPTFMKNVSSSKSGETIIEMQDYISGDANADEQLDIADAVMIMQSIANPDEYQLTAQGRYNADIAGDNDGITAEDALAVQKKLVGID